MIATAMLIAACGGGGGSGGGGVALPIVGIPPANGGAPNPDDGNPSGYPHASEPIGTVRQIYDGALSPDLAVNTYRNIDRLFPTRTIEPGATSSALPSAASRLTQVSFMVGAATYSLAEFMSVNRVAGLLILKDGKIANETYQYGNTQRTRWMSMSVAKSITSTLIGAAVKDGYIASIDDQVIKYVPRLAGSAYDGVTVRNVMMMASGARWNETYTDPNSDRRQLLEAQISQKPGSAMDLMSKLPRAAAPGSVYNYSTGETQVAGEIVYNAVKKPLAQYLSEKIWSKVGMEAQANWWLDSPGGVEIGGSGISATLRDYGRFGLFVMNDGMAAGQQVVPTWWIAEAGTPKVLTGGNPINYGYLWWIPSSGPSAADGAFYANGIMGQQIYINRKEKVVIVVWSAQTDPAGNGTLPVVPFFDAVVAALK
ncbi:CubicO group peptidase (beta-lactamase class C family) [Variovorax paradoxus]|uniref:CubicO group peptidase (Beta-lactamase class C family) n=1 Tax=Variovorax paradoxus TaxID=34073 RepID=A0AAE3Y322_VARPD|nr:serine hydrolase [Variovorax paradoxus]MDR6429669.1 CubicO group peptidase (beta-lactamase class C family) [Variovorax paradoxus]MDR6456051.1 CubicO group peptidase (beta-lactamase class C family) [Variovorax paradoxus]